MTLSLLTVQNYWCQQFNSEAHGFASTLLQRRLEIHQFIAAKQVDMEDMSFRSLMRSVPILKNSKSSAGGIGVQSPWGSWSKGLQGGTGYIRGGLPGGFTYLYRAAVDRLFMGVCADMVAEGHK